MAVEDLIIPKYYENKLDIISTEIAIKYVKDLFERDAYIRTPVCFQKQRIE